MMEEGKGKKVKSEKVESVNSVISIIGNSGRVNLPLALREKYALAKGDYIEWHMGENVEVTFGEMVKKEKGKVT